MTKEDLLSMVQELDLEPITKNTLIARISNEGPTKELRAEIKELVEKRIELNRQQQELIDQAIAEVAKTDAEVAKIVQGAEEELSKFEQEAVEEFEKLSLESTSSLPTATDASADLDTTVAPTKTASNSPKPAAAGTAL